MKRPPPPKRPALSGLSAGLRGLAGGVAVLLLAAGCNYHYSRGVTLEAQERWEEAAIEYRLAYVDDPGDPDFVEALARTNKVVARENLDRYKAYLAEKQFQKAYARLVDSALRPWRPMGRL